MVQNFLLVGPYFQRVIFRPQWLLPLARIILELWPPRKFLATEHMPRITVKLRIGNARRAARVAILPDNCHPSSFTEAY